MSSAQNGPALSGVSATFEHMSGCGVGPVAREALDRAREGIVARRRAYYRGLEDIAELERLAVAQQTW